MMNNPREQQFAGFSRLLWEELMDMVREEITHIEQGAEMFPDAVYEAIIAKRAYDLAAHVLANVRLTYVKDVPDMTAWPEEEQA